MHQAAAIRRREARTMAPVAPKPMIIIAQVAGSGTAEATAETDTLSSIVLYRSL